MVGSQFTATHLDGHQWLVEKLNKFYYRYLFFKILQNINFMYYFLLERMQFIILKLGEYSYFFTQLNRKLFIMSTEKQVNLTRELKLLILSFHFWSIASEHFVFGDWLGLNIEFWSLPHKRKHYVFTHKKTALNDCKSWILIAGIFLPLALTTKLCENMAYTWAINTMYLLCNVGVIIELTPISLTFDVTTHYVTEMTIIYLNWNLVELNHALLSIRKSALKSTSL